MPLRNTHESRARARIAFNQTDARVTKIPLFHQ
jgi:hypothetical protein